MLFIYQSIFINPTLSSSFYVCLQIAAAIVCVCVCVVQRKVDRELFLLFSVMDENLSWYLQRNIETYGSDQSDPDNEDFQESNNMHGMKHAHLHVRF